MASSAASVSAEQNPLGKRLNNQTKYLLMKLWNYFEQEVNKSKVSVNVKQRISKATGIKYLLCSWVWYSFRHVGKSEDGVPQERWVFYAKKKVQKQFAGGYSIHLIVTAGTDIHESVLMQTVSTGMQSDGK